MNATRAFSVDSQKLSSHWISAFAKTRRRIREPHFKDGAPVISPQGIIKNMSLRRRSRIVAMQILYQIQLTAAPAPMVMERFWQSQDTSAELRPFAMELVEGTTAHLETIDTLLQNTSKNWKLHRMPIVDLSILRCATYEILYLDDIDPATSINEAVEIAKSYSTPDSPKFINGVLDNIHKNKDTYRI